MSMTNFAAYRANHPHHYFVMHPHGGLALPSERAALFHLDSCVVEDILKTLTTPAMRSDSQTISAKKVANYQTYLRWSGSKTTIPIAAALEVTMRSDKMRNDPYSDAIFNPNDFHEKLRSLNRVVPRCSVGASSLSGKYDECKLEFLKSYSATLKLAEMAFTKQDTLRLSKRDAMNLSIDYASWMLKTLGEVLPLEMSVGMQYFYNAATNPGRNPQTINKLLKLTGSKNERVSIFHRCKNAAWDFVHVRSFVMAILGNTAEYYSRKIKGLSLLMCFDETLAKAYLVSNDQALGYAYAAYHKPKYAKVTTEKNAFHSDIALETSDPNWEALRAELTTGSIYQKRDLYLDRWDYEAMVSKLEASVDALYGPPLVKEAATEITP